MTCPRPLHSHQTRVKCLFRPHSPDSHQTRIKCRLVLEVTRSPNKNQAPCPRSLSHQIKYQVPCLRIQFTKEESCTLSKVTKVNIKVYVTKIVASHIPKKNQASCHRSHSQQIIIKWLAQGHNDIKLPGQVPCPRLHTVIWTTRFVWPRQIKRRRRRIQGRSV